MEIITNTLDFELHTDTAVAMGKFDGLHIGHRLLLADILEKRSQGLKACVFTFDPSPATFFGLSDGKELTTREEKRTLFSRLGIDILVEFPMTKESAAMSAERFVSEVLAGRLKAAWVTAGTDLSFGWGGAGNVELLKDLATVHGYGVNIVEKLRDRDREISSTYVRSLIEAGDMQAAARLLGTPYMVMGTVEHGNHRGSSWGMPTANLVPPENKLLPPNGVYYSGVVCGGRRYVGISNVGYKPTVADERVMGVETYIYDFAQDIYGQEIEVELYEFRRPEKRFDSVEALTRQLEEDKAAGRIYAKTQK